MFVGRVVLWDVAFKAGVDVSQEFVQIVFVLS